MKDNRVTPSREGDLTNQNINVITTDNAEADIFVGKRPKSLKMDNEAYSDQKANRTPASRGLARKESKDTLDTYQPQNIK